MKWYSIFIMSANQDWHCVFDTNAYYADVFLKCEHYASLDYKVNLFRNKNVGKLIKTWNMQTISKSY